MVVFNERLNTIDIVLFCYGGGCMSLFKGLKKISKNPRFLLCLPWYITAGLFAIVITCLSLIAWMFEELGGLIQKLSDALDGATGKLLHAKKVIKWIDKGFASK